MASAGEALAMTEWQFHRTDDGAHPSANEQQVLWLMNRARMNPAREGEWLATSREPEVAAGREFFEVDISVLRQEFNALRAMPPAAFDRRLYSAAVKHARALIRRDAQDHDGQRALVTDSGFNWRVYRGNVFSYSTNALNAHAAFNIDWGQGTPDGMQVGRGHRKAIMSADGAYTNVGFAAVAESNANTEVGELVVVGNYSQAYTSGPNHHNKFIVGTVYEDANSNGRYDIGEGKPNVFVLPSDGSYYAITSEGGGYSIPITFQGRTTVRFAGDDIADYAVDVVERDQSMLVDYVTNRVYSPDDVFPTVAVSVGEIDRANYGFRWGNGENPVSVKAEFAGTGRDLAIGARGHDIDLSDEVEVILNGKSVGFLSRTENASTASRQDWFVLSKADLRSWNTVEFRQKNPGLRWGVTDIELKDLPGPSVYASVDASADTQLYGWPGDNPGIVRVNFFARNKDLSLSAFGEDIDFDTEVAIYVNNRSLGWLKSGENNATAPRTNVVIPRTWLMPDGNNEIEFRAQRPWTRWGVQKLSISDVTGPDVTLIEGNTATGAYGQRYGSNVHRAVIRTQFTSYGKDVRYRYAAYDIDSDTEAAIYLNDEFVAFVPKTGNKDSLVQNLFFSATQLRNGLNTLEFRRSRIVGPWGVFGVLVRDVTGPTIRLSNDIVHRKDYGWGSTKYRTHQGVLRASFVNPDNPVTLLFTGWDLESRREVLVYLNGEQLDARPLRTENELSVRNSMRLDVDQMTTGTNVLEFRVTDATDGDWGVSNILLRVTNNADNYSASTRPALSSTIKAASSEQQ